jgi:hypothetical protein
VALVSDGSFSTAARAAIYGRTGDQCAGCRAPATNIQHRVARGMGGTRDARKGHPANGIPLCGSGTTGCHGWAEANPEHALALGWRLPQGADPLEWPYWSAAGPWRWVLVDPAGFIVYVDEDEDITPEQRDAARLAVESLREDRRTRA